MKELMDFVTVSAVVIASIFFALLLEPLLLEAVLVLVDRGIRCQRDGEYQQGHFTELRLSAIPVVSSGPQGRR